MFYIVKCIYIFIALVEVQATKPKSVNLALETVLEFGNENNADTKFLNDIQQFLETIKQAVDNRADRRSNDKNVLKLTDFVKELLNVLKSYEDEDLQDLLDVFDAEIHNYNYKGSKFHELLGNHDMRRYFNDKLFVVREAPANLIRKNLEKALYVLDNAKLKPNATEILDSIDALYGNTNSKQFKRILTNFRAVKTKSKRNNIQLLDIVRDALRTVVFDYYSKLDFNTRHEYKVKLDSLWEKFSNFDVKHKLEIYYPKTNRHSKEIIKQYRNKAKYVSTNKNTPKLMEVNDVPKRSKKHKEKPLMTLYPETIKTKKTRFKIKSTKHERVQTLWTEMTTEHKYRGRTDDVLFNFDDLNAEINVTDDSQDAAPDSKSINKRTKISKHRNVQKENKNKHRVDRHGKSRYKDTNKKRRESNDKLFKSRTTKTTGQLRVKLRSFKINSKEKRKTRKVAKSTEVNFKSKTSNDPEEGMTIESYEIDKKSFRKSYGGDAGSKDVLRRIENLEKGLEEVKSVVSTKQGHSDYSDVDTSTYYPPLDYWTGTTSATTTTNTKMNDTMKVSYVTKVTNKLIFDDDKNGTITRKAFDNEHDFMTEAVHKKLNDTFSEHNLKNLTKEHSTNEIVSNKTITNNAGFKQSMFTVSNKMGNLKNMKFKENLQNYINKHKKNYLKDMDNHYNEINTNENNIIKDKNIKTTNMFIDVKNNEALEADIQDIMKKYNFASETDHNLEIQDLLRSSSLSKDTALKGTMNKDLETIFGKSTPGSETTNKYNDPFGNIGAGLGFV